MEGVFNGFSKETHIVGDGKGEAYWSDYMKQNALLCLLTSIQGFKDQNYDWKNYSQFTQMNLSLWNF